MPPETTLPSTPSREVPLWPIIAAGAALLGALVALVAGAESAPAAAGSAAGFLTVAVFMVLLAVRRVTGPSPLDKAFMGLEGRRGAPPYAAAMEALPDPILVISGIQPDDVTGRRYVLANAAARRLLHLERDEGLLVTAVRDPEVLEAADEALFGGVDAERIYEVAGVQARTLRALARPLSVEPDGLRLALLIFRDETEFRRVERTRADFLANASHELRTPLASLSGFIETLRGHARDDPAARERFLTIMQAQAGRMSRLIEDLMSLSRIELNEYVAPADRVDLRSAVTDVVDAVTPLAREQKVTLELDLARADTACIPGDRDQIIQVVQNLVDNALKYSPRGKVVRISIDVGLSAEAAVLGQRPGAARLSLLTPDHAVEAYTALRVSDEGPGIARENLPRLTERFYRVEGQKSGEREGTGLGLAIVKHIANRHRGGLVVESAPGAGSTFTAYFPVLTPPVRRETEDVAIKLS